MIPEGFTGWVEIKYGQADGPSIKSKQINWKNQPDSFREEGRFYRSPYKK
jgi:hypothetical protein